MKPLKVLVTGATSGLGQAIAEKFLDSGSEVYFHGRDPKQIQTTLKNPRAHFVPVDLRKVEGVEPLISLVKQESIQCFVNNAGIYSDLGENVTATICVDLMNTNLVAPILVLKEVYKYFKEAEGGTIVNINSLAGLSPNFKEAVYCASKFGLKGFIDSLQLDAYKHRVRILDYYIGAVKTRITQSREGFDSFIEPQDVADRIVSDVTEAKTFLPVRQELRKTPGARVSGSTRPPAFAKQSDKSNRTATQA